MTATLLDSEAVGFADGSGGHVYTYPLGAPNVGEVDVLCINSNTVVSTPSGFTLHVNATNDQGAYIFSRKAVGGEAATTTVTTTGDHNTELTWSRWAGVNAFSAGNFQRVDGVNGTSLPATTTGVLAATNMLLIAFGALHNFGALVPTLPMWINSFIPLEEGSQGGPVSATSVAAFTAYKTNAGTASETIDSVTWSNNSSDRYALWVSFTTLEVTGSAVTGTFGAELPPIEADLEGDVTVTGTATITLPTISAAATGQVLADGTLTAILPTLSFAATGSVDADGALGITLPTLSFAATGDVLADVDGDLEATLPGVEATLDGATQIIDIFSQAFAVVTGVGMCAVEELDRTEAGAPDRICLLVPGEIAWDECQCGQFAQTITQDVPSENFPIAATDRRTTACGPQHLVVSVTASLARCVPGVNPRTGEPPSCESLLTAARRLEDDRTALRLGVTCCLLALRNSYAITEYTVGTAVTQGPQGGCVAVELTYQFGLRNVCCGVD